MYNKNEEIPIVYRKADVRKIFRISAKRLTQIIQRGDIRVINLGGEILIPRSEIERLLGQDLRFVDLAALGIKLQSGRKVPVREARIRKI